MARTFFAPLAAVVFVMIALAPACAQPRSKKVCYDAYKECAFTFINTTALPRFDISVRPDRSFTKRIASKNHPRLVIGVLNSNDLVPEFVSRGAVVPITARGSPSFTPTHFKPFLRGWGSGIGHETFQGNQLRTATGRCIRVYFSSYQILDGGNGTVVDNINGLKKKDGACVVFRAMRA